MLLFLPLFLLQPPAAEPLDRVRLANGSAFEGVVRGELPGGGLRFQVVRREPGRPTAAVTLLLDKSEVAGVDRVSDEQRKRTLERLAKLDPDGRGERSRMDGVALAPAPWPGPGAKPAVRYESESFALVSRAPEEVTRRAAVRLEDLFTAFRRFGPPRPAGARRTEILLAGSAEEYRELVAGRPELAALAARHPALYDPSGPRVLCGSDLAQIGAKLAAHRLAHAQQFATVARYEDDVRRLYKGHPAELNRFLEGAAREKRRLAAADRANDAAFAAATRRLFALLFHEAAHADAAAAGPPLPRWLDEGLAQLFEAAFVEAGELQAGRPDPARLARLQAWLAGKGGAPLPLAELLRAGPVSFLAAHAADAAAADRAYLTSWGVASYLLLERRLLGTEARGRYAAALAAGADPVAAFESLTGEPLEVTEAKWKAYVRSLPGG